MTAITKIPTKIQKKDAQGRRRRPLPRLFFAPVDELNT
jgi:hypothetical protein